MWDEILTAITLGLIGGITPGPVILLAFSEILRSKENGLLNGGMYLFAAGMTEFFIGLFLIIISDQINIPAVVFHILALLGVIVLLYLASQIYKIHRIDSQKNPRKIGIGHIVILMLLNGPLWLFWLSVCLPEAFKLGESLSHGEYLFVVIFEIAMMAGLGAMLFGFHSCRNLFRNEKIVHRVFLLLSVLLVGLAAKILYSEFLYFFG